MQNSLWTLENMPEFPSLDGDMTTNVLIIGGGMAGLLCAFELKQVGIDSVLIEKDRICRGVTGGTTAKITAQHGLIYEKLTRKLGLEAAGVYYEANQAAVKRFKEMAEQFPCDFEIEDNYIYSTTSQSVLDGELKVLAHMGAEADLVKSTDLPFPVAGAIRFPGQGRFHPLKFAAGIAGDLNIYEHTPARSFGKGWVMTDRGRIKADAVIVATHFPIINKHGGYFLKLYQQRSYVLALEKRNR